MMKDEIVEFINRRFKIDCDWLNGNCYFFAKILQSRFMGTIVYDPIDGHFLFKSINNNYYDWSGLRMYTKEQIAKFKNWEDYILVDMQHYLRIRRDCIE